ncbi:MAG: endonuclease/exonuclease/phosphatase family protein [Angustibacter sp.]
MTVGTFNVCSGRGPRGEVDLDLLSAAIAELPADVLAVQEIDRNQPRSHGADQLALAARAFGAVASRMYPTLIGVPGPATGWRPLPPAAPTAVQDAGHQAQAAGPDPSVDGKPTYGIGLLSRRPVLAWRSCHLGGSRAVLPFPVPQPDRRRPQVVWVPDEPRVALAAVVQTEAGPLTVISTHLSFAPLVAGRQLRRLVRWAATLPGPRVLAGDLNLPGGWPARISGWHPLAEGRTYPAARPRVQLDHLLIDVRTVQHRQVPVTTPPLSDHLPLCAELADVSRTVAPVRP